MKQSSSWALAALLAGAMTFSGCGDSSEPLVPGSLQVVSGDRQTATAGTAVTTPPSIKLLSRSGKPMGGVQVMFAATADGAVAPTQVATNGQGIAILNSWTLPKRAGSHRLTVTSEGVPALVLTAEATAGPVARLLAGSPDVQDGIVGAVAGAAPTALVTDVFDNPVAGVVVRFTASGNGALTTTSAVTDENGLARSGQWTLATSAGEQAVTAEMPAHLAVPALVFRARVVSAPAAKLAVITQPLANDGSGERLSVPPVVEIQDAFSNRVASTTTPVTVSAAPGSTQALSGTLTVLPVDGRATFNDVVISGTGALSLQFSAGGLQATTSATFNVPDSPQCSGTSLRLDYALGQTARFVGNGSGVPSCLDLPATSAGQQYLIQFENLSLQGNSDTGVFPGTTTPQAGLQVSVATRTLNNLNVASSRVVMEQLPDNAVHSWDAGGGLKVYEVAPKEPEGGADAPYVMRNGKMFSATSASADVVVGDTIVAAMEGIPRLGISFGNQRAVVRYVGPDLIIAEDVRLGTTLTRQNGTRNTPLTPAEMEAIAADYAQYAKVQADLFFGGRYNATIEANHGGRVIAIHSLMGADNIWGYTYPSGNYFVWDYWVLSPDGQTKTAFQSTEWNANMLFMHEIAHMRHFGLNERNGKTIRGNRWLVEGFARASERWPVAMRLLNTTQFSRISNEVLPRFPTTTLNAVADVPDVRYAATALYEGYASSAYIFDYFADQAAAAGADWRVALADFVMNAGTETSLNAAIARYLPGVDFGTLLTRARIALYMDDYGAGLPAWTQFLQFQLRASRRGNASGIIMDARDYWARIVPGTAFGETRDIFPGGAFGYVLDGTAGSANTRVSVTLPPVPYGIFSITRIK